LNDSLVAFTIIIFLIAISVSSKLVRENITVDDEPIDTSPKSHSLGLHSLL